MPSISPEEAKQKLEDFASSEDPKETKAAPVEDPPTEEEETSDSEAAEPAEEGLSETEAAEAKNLYRALKDPKTSSALISALAHQAGLLKQLPTTHTAETKAKSEIKDLLRESLGPEYAFLADRLGPAIEKALAQERLETESQLERQRRAVVESDVKSAFDRLSRETKGDSQRFEARMEQLSEEIPIGPGMSADRYLKILYQQAKVEYKDRLDRLERDKRIKRNAEDAPSRLQATASGSRSEMPSKKLSLNESIAWAQQQVEKQRR